MASEYIKSVSGNNNPYLKNKFYFLGKPVQRLVNRERDTNKNFEPFTKVYIRVYKSGDYLKAQEEYGKYLENSYKYTHTYIFKTEILELRAIGEIGLKLLIFIKGINTSASQLLI